MQIETKCSFGKMVKISKLKPHPSNPNDHSEGQVALLAAIILEMGWRHPILVSKRSGFVVAGHCRLLSAERLEVESVPVDYQDFADEAQEIKMLLNDNKIAEFGEINKGAASDIFARLDKANSSLATTGYSPKEIEKIRLNDGGVLADKEDGLPDMELQPYESYDYIVLMFKNTFDWIRACQLFDIKKCNYSNIKEKKKIGLGRVVDGARILQKHFNQKGNRKPKPK